MRKPIAVTGKKTRQLSCLLQFRTIDVTVLEKRQQDSQNASLAGFEFRLLATLRRRAIRQVPFFAERELVLRSVDDPNSGRLRTTTQCDRPHENYTAFESFALSELDEYRSRSERISALYEQLDLIARIRFNSRSQTAA